jgi:hypothetical protein
METSLQPQHFPQTFGEPFRHSLEAGSLGCPTASGADGAAQRTTVERTGRALAQDHRCRPMQVSIVESVKRMTEVLNTYPADELDQLVII